LARGLIVESPTFRHVMSVNDTWEDIWKRKNYVLSPFGEKFIKLNGLDNFAINSDNSNVNITVS
jgi:predicted metal-dependent hydrolase